MADGSRNLFDRMADPFGPGGITGGVFLLDDLVVTCFMSSNEYMAYDASIFAYDPVESTVSWCDYPLVESCPTVLELLSRAPGFAAACAPESAVPANVPVGIHQVHMLSEEEVRSTDDFAEVADWLGMGEAELTALVAQIHEGMRASHRRQGPALRDTAAVGLDMEQSLQLEEATTLRRAAFEARWPCAWPGYELRLVVPAYDANLVEVGDDYDRSAPVLSARMDLLREGHVVASQDGDATQRQRHLCDGRLALDVTVLDRRMDERHDRQEAQRSLRGR